MSIRHLALAVVTALFVWATLRAARTSGGRNPILMLARSAFVVPQRPWAHLGVGLALGVATVVAPVLAAASVGWLELVGQPPAGGTAVLFAESLVLIGLWATLEEFIFRGVLMPAISACTNVATGIVASALLFALPHVGARGGAFEDGFSIALWVVDGLAFGLAAFASRSLWLPTAWHMAKNVAVWLVLDGSTLALTPGWWTVRYVQESWLAGGANRAGALDVAAALLAAGALLAVTMRRRAAGR